MLMPQAERLTAPNAQKTRISSGCFRSSGSVIWFTAPGYRAGYAEM